MDAKEKDQILESLFKDNPGAEMPQEVEIRLRRHLATLRERMETSKGKERPSRLFSWSMALRYATPAVAFILILFIAYLFMPGGGHSQVYADAVEQLRKARSLTYTLINQFEDPTKGYITTEQEAVFKEPNLCRYSYPDGSYSVINSAEHKDLFVSPANKQYIETVHYNVQEEFQVAPVIDEMRSLPKRADEVPKEREMDGRNVRGFRVTRTSVTKTLWIDVDTGDLVRMEVEYLNAPGNRLVMKNIRFDIEYEDSFFSLEPPSGFTGIKRTHDGSPVGEQDLINALDVLTSHHVNAMFPESWNYNDMSIYLDKFVKSGTIGKTDEEITQISDLLNRGFNFVMFLEPGKWYYAGKGVKRGAADTPVFWYKPDRLFLISIFSKTYRVIYADLTVRDVAPKDLPPVTAE